MKNKTQKNNKISETKSNDNIRLNKFLADAGVASRRKADELIKGGAVKVNGKIIVDLGSKVNPSDFITVFDDPIKQKNRNIYILLNKPKNCITTTSDEMERKTVMDIVKSRERLYPVGRLDRNTTGVLLMTNDGELTYRLTHPKYNVERVYNAGLDKGLKANDAQAIAKGVDIGEGRSAPCELFINPKDKTQVSISLNEGKNHEIKRIFEAFGYDVRKLDRKYFAGLSNTGLDRGEYRHLTLKEVQQLKKLVGIK